MLDRFTRLFSAKKPNHAPEEKTSKTGPLIALYETGLPQWTPRDYAALMREGFEQNPIVYRSIRMIAEAVASVPFLYFDGRQEIVDHPMEELLCHPNPGDSGVSLREALIGYLLGSGNGYLECVSDATGPRELYALRPDRMRVVPGADGWPEAYTYSINGESVSFDMTGSGIKPILHLTLFNPLSDHYGLSPISAAAYAIDVHNAASAWNKSLLDNGARPSGALVYQGPVGSSLSADQFDRLKAELEESFQGAANAGRPLLLEGGLDWKPLSLSPKDMDFMEAKAAAAREIALAFGIPAMLLGLPGDNRHANFAEANQSFWRQTVLPLATRVQEAIAQWLSPVYGPIDVQPDLDRITALSDERTALWTRINAATFLTDDEKREAVGYGARGSSPAQSGGPSS
jgi:HK97 family phage portal protein